MRKVLIACSMAFVLFALTGCLGPKPQLQDVTSTPPPANTDQPFRVEALLSNVGPGDGDVEVEVRLTNKKTGEVLVSDAKDFTLQKDDKQHILFNLDLPEAARSLDPNDIDVNVDAHYPIE